MERPHRHPLLLLGPLARAADLVARRRRSALARAAPGQLPTLAVHGLALGGAGKTPAVLWAAARLAGRLPGAVAVGTREPAVVRDEIELLRRRLPRSPVFAAADPAAAIARARAAGCAAVVLDDPSLSRSAPAHFRLLCLGPGDGWHVPAFPAGDRRPGAVRPAEADHLLLLDGASRPPGSNLPAAHGRTVPLGFVPFAAWREGASSPLRPAADLFVLCAVARPERVLRTAEALGARVVGSCLRRDHAVLPPALLARVERQARAAGASRIAITEKDAARLAAAGTTPGEGARGPEWVVLRTELRVDGEEILDRFLSLAAIDSPCPRSAACAARPSAPSAAPRRR